LWKKCSKTVLPVNVYQVGNDLSLVRPNISTPNKKRPV
jgi:hypothetical protein